MVIYLFKELFNIIKNNDLKITIINNKIDIINYKEILDFSFEKIKIKCENKIISIYGDDLIINKLLKDEVLILGDIIDIKIERIKSD